MLRFRWSSGTTPSCTKGRWCTAPEPYLRQVLENFVAARGAALTGPLSRGDSATVGRNLNALSGDRLQGLYRAFLDCHAEAQS